MEIEAKFSIPDEQMFQQVLSAGSLAGFLAGDESVEVTRDRYLDTAGRALLSAGYACRLRITGDRYLVTVKGWGSVSGPIHRRDEYEAELPEPLAPEDWPPSPARDLILTICNGDALLPLFDLKQIRHKRSLQDRGRPVAQLSLDHVRVLQSDAEAAAYIELEVELLPGGSVRDLERMAAELQEGWGLEPQTRSKFERALAMVDNATVAGDPVAAKEPAPSDLLVKPDIEPDDAMSEAGRRIFRFQFRRMLYREAGTRLGEDIEELHDMRVATRRLRAAFRVFGDYFDPEIVKPLLKGLKRTGRALGAVRDLDVFRVKILAYQASLPESQQTGLEDLLSALEAEHRAARERMVAYLNSRKYRRFVETFGEFVESEGMGSLPVAPGPEGPRPYRVRYVAPVSIYERLAVVRAYDEWVSVPEPRLAHLHALRIACKRLRYTLEFFGTVLGPDAKPVVKRVVAAQDHLGELQDAVVASGILHHFLVWGTWGTQENHVDQPEPETATAAPGVAAYLAAKQAEIQDLRDTFPRVWRGITSEEFGQMVARAIAVL